MRASASTRPPPCWTCLRPLDSALGEKRSRECCNVCTGLRAAPSIGSRKASECFHISCLGAEENCLVSCLVFAECVEHPAEHAKGFGIVAERHDRDATLSLTKLPEAR